MEEPVHPERRQPKDPEAGSVPGDQPGIRHLEEVRRRLLDHYDAHQRELPWRKEEDPYRIWVSEVMLQQTRVDTVIPYYRRWIERFPGLDDLASAEQEEVLQMWKGLGYYSRARNLHRAARMVRERHGGRVPDSTKELRELPGVGEYTAGAVASIAFGRPEPAVDGNVRRVLSRLYDLPDPGDAELRRRAAALVDPRRPGCFNQALMELGATVCTPSSPDCPTCPLEDLCLARERGTVEDRPKPRERATVTPRRMAVAIPVSTDGRTLLVRRPESGLLGGLWEFPAHEIEEEPADPAARAREAAEDRGVVLGGDPPASLGSFVHSFTHLRVTYHLHLFRKARLEESAVGSKSGSEEVRVVPLTDLDGLPLPVAQQKVGRRALKALGGDGDGAEAGVR